MSRKESDLLVDNMAAFRAIRHGSGQLLNGERYPLAHFILRNMNKDGEFYWGTDKIAEETNINRTNVRRHLKTFVECGALTDLGVQPRGKYRSVHVYQVHFEHLLGESPNSPSTHDTESEREPREESERESEGEPRGEFEGESNAAANLLTATDSAANNKTKPLTTTPTPTVLESPATDHHSRRDVAAVGEVLELIVARETAATKTPIKTVEGFTRHLRPVYAPIIEKLERQYPDLAADDIAGMAFDLRNDRTPPRRSPTTSSTNLERLDVAAVVPTGTTCDKCGGVPSRCPLQPEVAADDPQCLNYNTLEEMEF